MGALKLYEGPANEFPATDRQPTTVPKTLKEAYLENVLASAAVSSSTARSYLQSLDWWETLTENPPLDELRQADVSAFRADLAATMPATTANKHLRSLRTILNRLGPASARYPDAAELVSKIPFVKLLTEAPPVPLHFTDEELNALWKAASKLTWPRVLKIKPAAWWRGVLVLGITYGPRIGDLLGLSRHNLFIGEDRELWIRWRAQKTGKVHAWPMTEATCKALDPLNYDPTAFGADPKYRLIPAPKNPAKLYATFRTWCALAGIVRPETLSFHALRSTAAKRYDAVQPGLGAVILGHAVENTVTNKHYLGDAALADAYDAIRTLTPPTTFL